MSYVYDEEATVKDVRISDKPGYTTILQYNCHKPISEEKAMRLQTHLGYHPAGYGFYGYSCDGKTTKWTSSRSCD